MKLILKLFSLVLMLTPATLMAQTPALPGIGVKVSALATIGEGYEGDYHWYTFTSFGRETRTGANIPVTPNNTIFGTTNGIGQWPYPAGGYAGGPPHSPFITFNTPAIDGTIRTFPSYLYFGVVERFRRSYCCGTFCLDQCTDIYVSERNVALPLPYTMVVRHPATQEVLNNIFSLTKTYTPTLPNTANPNRAEFINGGYVFLYSIDIPVLPTTGFFTYSKPERLIPFDRFCHGDVIYADTYYKRPNEAIRNARFEWEYQLRGRAPVYYTTTDATGYQQIPTAGVALPNPADTATAWIRVRMIGPPVTLDDAQTVAGLLGSWSAKQKIVLYPKPPDISMQGIDSLAPLNSVDDLVEQNLSGNIELQHIACTDSVGGKIIIRSINETKGYYLTVRNHSSGAVMNYKVRWKPTPQRPIILPDTALTNTTNSNTPFEFDHGDYEMIIQSMDLAKDSIFGCYSSQLFRIKQPGKFQTDIHKVKYHSSDVSCYDQTSNGRIQVTPVGGIGPYQYTLRGYEAASQVYQQSPAPAASFLFKDLSAMNNNIPVAYQLTAIDAAGCPAANMANGTLAYNKEYQATPSPVEGEDLILKVPGPLVIDHADVNAFRFADFSIRCHGAVDSTRVYISGGEHRYAAWLEGNGLSNYQRRDSVDEDLNIHQLTFTDLHAGDYRIVAVDRNGCIAEHALTFTEPLPLEFATTKATDPACFGQPTGSVYVRGTGGVKINGDRPYLYSQVAWPVNVIPAATQQGMDMEYTNLIKGQYTMRITDALGCHHDATFTLNEPSALVASFTEIVNPHCFGDETGSISLTSSGGTAPLSYQWSGGSTSPSKLEGVGAGTYSVTVTDANNCTLVLQQEITEPAEVFIYDNVEEFYCAGQSTTLDAGNPGATYRWNSSNGLTSSEQQITVNTTGVYDVTVTDARGCSGTASFDLVFDPNVLETDYISSTEAIAGDTVVFINITFPEPDEMTWNFPEGVNVIEANNYFHYVVFPAPGVYEIMLRANKGACYDEFIDTITILERSTENGSAGRTASHIRTFNTHPNPSNGKFNIEVELREESEIKLEILAAVGGIRWGSWTDAGKSQYELTADISAPPGVYFIVLSAGTERSVKRVVVY